MIRDANRCGNLGKHPDWYLGLPSVLATGQTSTPSQGTWWDGAALMNEIRDYQAVKLDIEIAEKTKNHAMKFFKTEP